MEVGAMVKWVDSTFKNRSKNMAEFQLKQQL
jgi:hypothetical protein